MSRQSWGSDRKGRSQNKEQGQNEEQGNTQPPDGASMMRLANLVTEKAGAAVDAGIAPTASEAAPYVEELVSAFAAANGRTDDPAYRRELRDQVTSGTDPRAERYWQLLAVINGWPPIPTTVHLWTWFAAAL